MDHRLKERDPALDKIHCNPPSVVYLVANTPGDEHFLLDVGQKLRVILAGEVQTFSMEAEDLQAVQHVEQDVGLLKLGHFLKKKTNKRKKAREMSHSDSLSTFIIK